MNIPEGLDQLLLFKFNENYLNKVLVPPGRAINSDNNGMHTRDQLMSSEDSIQFNNGINTDGLIDIKICINP